MRIAIALMLLACLPAGATTIQISTVDLDKPGALEALHKNRPDHYRKVMEEIEKAQAIALDPRPVMRDALMDGRSRGATTIMPTDPAKKRISVLTEDLTTEYRVTVHMTKNPATLQRAR